MLQNIHECALKGISTLNGKLLSGLTFQQRFSQSFFVSSFNREIAINDHQSNMRLFKESCVNIQFINDETS